MLLTIRYYYFCTVEIGTNTVPTLRGLPKARFETAVPRTVLSEYECLSPDMMSASSNLWTMHKMLSRDAQFTRHVVSLRRPRCLTAYDLVLGQRRSPSSVVDLGVLVVGGRVRKSAERCSRAISAIRSPSPRTNRPRTNTKNTQIEGKGCTSSSVS